MTRLNHLLLAASLALLGATAAQATPVGNITLTASQRGGAPTTTVVAGVGTAFVVSYQVTNLAPGQSAHLEVDFCDPALGVSLISGGSARALSTCVDGEGNHTAVTVVSPPLSASGSSTGVTGTFTIASSTAPALSHNGDIWNVPARLILDGASGGPLSTAALALTIQAGPRHSITKYASTKHLNSDNTTDVTWVLSLENPIEYDGVEVDYGTTTITDAADDGSTYIAGSQVPASVSPLQSPRWTALNPNSNVTISQPSDDPTSVTMVARDVITSYLQDWFPSTSFSITFHYPAVSTATVVTNTAHVSFPDGSTQTASASTIIGPDTSGAVGTISKSHYCLNGYGFTNITANLPNLLDNAGCYWAPEAVLEYAVSGNVAASDNQYQAMPLSNGDVIDALPPQVVFQQMLQDDQPTWPMTVSTDATCTLSSTWVTLTAANRTSVHCLRFHQPAGDTASVFYFSYSVRLNPTERANLEAQQGVYEFVNNVATLSGDLLSVNGVPGGSGSVTLTSTFWNNNAPKDDLNSDVTPSFFYTPPVVVGQAFTYTGALPLDDGYVSNNAGLVNNFLGFHDLSFSSTLPPELDLTAAPTMSAQGIDPITNAPIYYVDAAGNPTHLSCTWAPQNRATIPVTPAFYRCEVLDQSNNPTYTPTIFPGSNPFTDCSPPLFCTSGTYDNNNVNGRTLIWNELTFTVPAKVVAGAPGQGINTALHAWSNEGNTAPGGLAYAGSSESNPAIATTYLIISGSPKLLVHTAATTHFAVAETPASFDISYSNPGDVTTKGTAIYDIFGYDPTTMQPLSTYQNLNCSMGIPVFDGVSHVSGVPASSIEYTTDDPSTATGGPAGMTWLPYNPGLPPSPLSAVTGLRFIPNSEFSSTPGDYSPTDQPGVEQIDLIAPNEPGKQLCSMSAISANGLTLAGSIDLSAAIVILTTPCVGVCDPTPVPVVTAHAIADATCAANVTLDASGSGDTTHYVWYEGTTAIASGDAPAYITTAQLSGAGSHFLTLVVSDDAGITASANATVTITDTTAPVLTCVGPTGPVTLSGCTPNLPAVTATALDGCEGAVAATCGIYQPGQTSVTCTASDSVGNVGTCSVAVTVLGDGTTPPAPSLAIGYTVGGVATGLGSLSSGTGSNSTQLGPNGGFCDNDFQIEIPFSWSPGCTAFTPSSLTSTLTYVDSSGHTQLVPGGYVSVQTGTDDSGNVYGIAYVSAPSTYDPNTGISTPIDFHGPLTFTLTGDNGSASVTFQAGFEPCTCNNTYDTGPEMVVFEDLWPSNGDLDFNDQTIVTDLAFNQDVNGNITSVRAQFNVLAVGADIESGLYFHLPGIAPSLVATVDRYYSDGRHDTNVQSVAGEDDEVIQIANDTRDLFNHQSGFINTQFGAAPTDGTASPASITAAQTSVAVTLIITFTAPLTSFNPGDGTPFLSEGSAPFDVFIARTADYTHQVHAAQYTGTTKMDTHLFDTVDDASLIPLGPDFVNGNGLPFAIVIPQIVDWPQERIDIANLYPEVANFVTYPIDQYSNPAYNYNSYYWYGEHEAAGFGVHLTDPENLPTAGPPFSAGFCPNND